MDIEDYSFVESYGLADGKMYILQWNTLDVVLGPVISFVNGIWRGRFAWKEQSPDFHSPEAVADWMSVRYMTRQVPDTKVGN